MDEVASAYFRWQALGRPELHRFGLTVEPGRERLWLDDQANVGVL